MNDNTQLGKDVMSALRAFGLQMMMADVTLEKLEKWREDIARTESLGPLLDPTRFAHGDGFELCEQAEKLSKLADHALRGLLDLFPNDPMLKRLNRTTPPASGGDA